MNKRDLIFRPSSPMSRLFKLNRFDDMFKEFDSLFGDWDLDMKLFTDMQPKTAFPKINVIETETSYEVEVALAGFDKEDIEIELKENCLCVKADKKEEDSEQDKKYLMKEISSRSFRRALNFPIKLVTDDIECNHKDGIIKCVLKKDIPDEPKDSTIKIKIS